MPSQSRAAVLEDPFAAMAFGPYRATAPFGFAGGQAALDLYRAEDRRSGRAVVVRSIAAPAFGEVAAREIRALARLGHPGLARIVDEGVDDGRPWYAMELPAGRSIAELRDEIWVHPLPSHEARPRAANGRLADVLELARALCVPLAHVHGRGFVLRDLRPDNVLVTPDGPVLIDFGAATRFPGARGREILERTASPHGPVAYAAPEHFARGIVDARADLYALGCILYELVCGRPPVTGATTAEVVEAHQVEPPLAPSRLVEGVPPALDALVGKLLGKRPRDRVGYAADVAAALEQVLTRLRRPVAATAGPRAQAGPVDEGFYLYRPAMTGREAVTDQLLEATADAIKGHGTIFFVGGEAGVGKTMLTAEISKQATALGLRVVGGSCQMLGGDAAPTATGLPLAPFRQLLRAVAEHCRARGSFATARIFGAKASALARIEPTLADVPGLAPPPADADLTGEAARSTILTAMADLLCAFAQEQPLLLVLDDLHWADELSLAVLKLLPPTRLVNLPLVIVATHRPDEAPPALRELAALGAAQRVVLGPLDHEGVTTMVTEMLGMSPPPAAMIRFLMRLGGGNPFLIAEYVRAAVAESLLIRHQGRWALASAADDRDAAAKETCYEALPLPRTLRELVRRRLAGLSPPAAAVLEAAAVAGRVVDPALVAAVIGSGSATSTMVHDALGELLARQVLEQTAGELHFAHENQRKHVYDAIDESRRRDLHLHVAEALEKQTGRDAHDLAYHFHAGGRADRALFYATLAGEHAQTAGALKDAHDQLTRALELEQQSAARGPGLPALGRARLRRMLGEARVGVGDVAGSEAILRDAYTIAVGRRLPTSGFGWFTFLLVQVAVQILHRHLPARRWQSRGDRRGALEEAALIANRVAFTFMVRAQNLPLLAVLTLAANLAERAGVSAPCGTPYSILAATLGLMGAKDLSRRYFEASRQAVSHARDLAVPLQQAQIEGYYYLNRAEWTAAHEVLDPAYERSQALGIPYEREALAIARGLVELRTGRTHAARQLLAEARESAESLGNTLHAGWARKSEAEALLDEDPRQALAVLAPAEAAFRQRDGVVDLINLLAIRARAHQRLDETDAAVAAALEASELAAKNPQMLSHCFELHALTPEVFLRASAAAKAQGDHAEARRLRRAALRRLRDAARYARMFAIGRPSLLLNRARATHTEGHDREAARQYERARAAATTLGMPLPPLF